MVRADASGHQDLLWALRGGGGNFGVVVSLDFTAQPVTSVHFGPVIYRLDALTGRAEKDATNGLPVAGPRPGKRDSRAVPRWGRGGTAQPGRRVRAHPGRRDGIRAPRRRGPARRRPISASPGSSRSTISGTAVLAALAASECDIDLVAYEMTMLVEEVGEVLTPPTRVGK
jgi:hypothetical protein